MEKTLFVLVGVLLVATALSAQTPDLSALEKSLGFTLTDAQKQALVDNYRKEHPWIAVDSTVAFKGVQFDVAVSDSLAKPFVTDPAVLGTWNVVDYVNTLEEFTPGWKNFEGQLYWAKAEFDKNFDVGVYLNGSKQNRVKWTKGFVLFNWSDTKVAANYLLKSISGKDYLFVEWRASGDYSLHGSRPGWYVFSK